MWVAKRLMKVGEKVGKSLLASAERAFFRGLVALLYYLNATIRFSLNLWGMVKKAVVYYSKSNIRAFALGKALIFSGWNSLRARMTKVGTTGGCLRRSPVKGAVSVVDAKSWGEDVYEEDTYELRGPAGLQI
jgi:hypothetical protein